MVVISIRGGLPEDMPALRGVFRESSLSNDDDRAVLLEHPEVLELSDSRVRDGHPIVAMADDQIAGFATTIDADGIMELDGLFVDPQRMRRGVGRQLVDAVVAGARARGIARIDVTANDHAVAFYERVGFVHDGVVESRFAPAARMHLDVDPA